MNGLILFLLKAILIVSLMGASYYIFKTYQNQKWNQILKNGQKSSGIIELLPVKYRVSYSLILVLFFVFFFTLNSPLSVANVISTVGSSETYTLSDSSVERYFNDYETNPDDQDIYIVRMKYPVEEYKFNLFRATSSDQITNFYEYQVDVLEEVYATTATMFTENNSTVVLSKTTSLTLETNSGINVITDLSSTSAENINSNEVYLIVGGYVTSNDVKDGDLIDYRLSDDNYIYTYEAILLDGYDLSKSLLEQSSEIKSIVEEMTKDLP